MQDYTSFNKEPVKGFVKNEYHEIEELLRENRELREIRNRITRAMLDYRKDSDQEAFMEEVRSAICGESMGFVYKVPWDRNKRVSRC
ncbi:MAG: hypothetical protein IJT63_04415 [Lachnospiraceae bacterium]|nr:hypothetical protein [Lachnospiraceae bacterium]